MATKRDEGWFSVGPVPSCGLLVLRLGTGLTMAFSHGWPKLQRLLGSAPIRFADPFGIGPEASLALAVFGELVCGVLIALGLATRPAALALAFTMIVAIVDQHWDDPWRDKEPAFMFLVPTLALALTGAGRYALDRLIASRRARR